MQTINGHDFQEDTDADALVHWVDQCQKCQADISAIDGIEKGSPASEKLAQ